MEPSRQHPNAQAQPCLSSEGEPLSGGGGSAPKLVGWHQLVPPRDHRPHTRAVPVSQVPFSCAFLLCFLNKLTPCKNHPVFKTKSQAIQSYSSKSNCNPATLHIYLYKDVNCYNPLWALQSAIQLPRDQIYASRISSSLIPPHCSFYIQ